MQTTAISPVPVVVLPADDDAPVTSARYVRVLQRAFTALLVLGPVAGLAVAIPLWWGDVVHLHDVIIAAALYLVTGFGITVGFHRLFTHRSFRPARPLKIGLAIAGSMAVEGSLIGWVAGHRRHHRFSDHPGDIHSPHLHGTTATQLLRGLVFAHVGWLFAYNPTSEEAFANDLRSDHDLTTVNRLFPVFAIASFALPFGLGWAITGTIRGALGTLLWAGAVRMMLLHHVTWSVNSICHMFGQRPFRTRDHSTNFAPLAVISFGESWHNLHHAYPTSARHGALRGQRDPSAALIRLFERAGWATGVVWPDPARLIALQGRPAHR